MLPQVALEEDTEEMIKEILYEMEEENLEELNGKLPESN